MITPVFKIMKFLAASTALQDMYNNHFGLQPGDPKHWIDYSTSPIFPVDEQPESEDFYILFNFNDAPRPEAWWHIDTTIVLYIATNNIALMADVSSAIYKEFADYEFAAQRINQWAVDNNVEGPFVNYSRYVVGEGISPQTQENGVYGRIIELDVNSVIC